jgi:hypothetical protein
MNGNDSDKSPALLPLPDLPRSFSLAGGEAGAVPLSGMSLLPFPPEPVGYGVANRAEASDGPSGSGESDQDMLIALSGIQTSIGRIEAILAGALQ